MSSVGVVAPHLTISALRGRLRISEGTWSPVDSTATLPFETGARLARGAWSRIPEGSTVVPPQSSPRRAATTVTLARFPAEVVQELRTIDQLGRASEQGGFPQGRLHSMIGRLVMAVRDSCGWTLRGDVLGIGFNTGPGGLSNTTLNSKTGRYVGLHLDSWDRLPAEERHRGQNRVCLNLGTGPRYLQFVPVTARELHARLIALEAVSSEGSARQGGDLARRFLRCFPDEPVMRLSILPGEAYIAPTENLVHDGCTLDTAGPDVTLTLRGHFEPLRHARSPSA
jgi:hypothetical protein